ncbi:ABC transporter substrate-binding protein [Halobellus captivus]|uniref:ABC transporter substrate-binding protein n=1 Tax=Halobellus captivus TaxID=2592614 RepID=UPI00119E0242|nr:ABC transporter substrate-binding protein [Halobellus captivus]
MTAKDVKTPTRRRYLKFGSAALTAGLLAGCTGGSGGEPADDAKGESTETATSTSATTRPDESHVVAMEPVGEVTFERVPERWLPYTGDYADMGVALGQGDGLAGIGVRARFGTHHYDELPGVDVDAASLTELWQGGTGKELFHEIDADVHVIDPNFMINRLQWSQSDVDEIEAAVAPFFGNTVFTRVYDWHDYEYYSLYEAFEKLSHLFDERERFEAFERYHGEVLADVESRLPPSTPDLAVLYPAELPPESFYPYLVGEGSQSKQWRDLRVGDALAQHGVTDAQAGGGTVDYEALLEIDPDAIAVRIQGEISEEYFRENVVAHMESHDVASQLTAVQDGRVFYGGLTYQGPIIHLFQLEEAARGLYPERFGEEELFDRQRVANIVTGAFES